MGEDDHTVEILAGIACAAEAAALGHFMTATAAFMQEPQDNDEVVADVFARAFATGLMKAAVGMLRDAGLTLSQAEETLRQVIGSEVFEASGGDA